MTSTNELLALLEKWIDAKIAYAASPTDEKRDAVQSARREVEANLPQIQN